MSLNCSQVKGTFPPPRSRGISMKRGLVRAAIARALDGEGGSAAAPAIALEAADQSLAMTVDLDNPFPATGAVH